MRILFILLLASLGLNAQDTRVDWDYHNKGYAGKFYIKNLVRSVDTTTYKLIGINPTTGEAVYMNWLYAGAGGGSTSPSGSNGYVQIYRNGLFKNASDSLVFTTLLAIKGGLSTTADMQISGISGFGMAPSSGVRAYFKGSGASTSTYGLAIQNSSAQNYLLARDDHLIQVFGNIDVDATPTASNPLGVVINAKSANNTSTTYNTTMKNSDNAYISTLANNGDLSVLNRVFIGAAPGTPTARLHLPAGTATAATGPLKFTRGTVMTTGEDGSMEFGNNARLFITRGTGRKAIPLSDTTTVADGSLLVGDAASGEFRITTPTFDATSNSGVSSGSFAVTLTGRLTSQVGGDADLTVSNYQSQVRLASTLTANRTITFPSAVVSGAYTVEIWNRNTSGSFAWQVSGSVVDAAGNAITTLVNSTYYIFKTSGVASTWVKCN